MKRRIISVLVIALWILAALTGCTPAEARYEGFHMDTYVTLTARGRGSEALLERCAQRLTELENALSAYRRGSDIRRLNEAGGEWTALGGDAFKLLEESLQYAELTGGAFDPTIFTAINAWDGMSGSVVPSDEALQRLKPLVDYTGIELDEAGMRARLKPGQTIDLGAISKGYAADCLFAFYQEAGCAGIINLGGNVYAVGTKENGGKWRVGVQDPRGNGGLIEVIDASDISAVTSGDYQRFFESGGEIYHHILDPETLKPARTGLHSVTVICESSTKADALATAVFVLGREAGGELLSREGLSALAVTDDWEAVWIGARE